MSCGGETPAGDGDTLIYRFRKEEPSLSYGLGLGEVALCVCVCVCVCVSTVCARMGCVCVSTVCIRMGCVCVCVSTEWPWGGACVNVLVRYPHTLPSHLGVQLIGCQMWDME